MHLLKVLQAGNRPVDKPVAMQICQWGSKTGMAASHPAVANWRSPTEPHPYTGRVLYSHRIVFTVLAKSVLIVLVDGERAHNEMHPNPEACNLDR